MEPSKKEKFISESELKLMSEKFSLALNSASREYGITLTAEQEKSFARYYELLLDWNTRVNLTAITAPEEAAVKHMIDSLTAYDEKYFAKGASIIDVGTGAGFPGLPLKLFCPGIKLTLVDSLAKRIKFLQEVTRALALENITLIHARAEDAARDSSLREKFDGAVSRAVASLPVLLEYTLPFVKVGGFFAALKGQRYEEEMNEAKEAARILGAGELTAIRKKLPGLDDVRAVIFAEKTKTTPEDYPRRAGLPERKPLS